MIVQLTGGLGNQMFGYAFGRSLALARGEEVFFTRNQVDGNTHGGYGLDAFDMDVRLAGKLTPPVYHEPHFHFDPNAINAAPGSSYVGYWQSEKYFDALTIRSDFVFRASRIRNALKFGRSAFIHVRRGDYLKEPHKSWHGVLPLDYYRAGVAQILANEPDTEFLIFSDDPDWCFQNFPSPGSQPNPFAHKFMIIQGTTPIQDLYLMSLCKHAVIANSSFSWWGAWLGGSGNDRIVIAPKQWFATPTLDTRDLIPDRWMQI